MRNHSVRAGGLGKLAATSGRRLTQLAKLKPRRGIPLLRLAVGSFDQVGDRKNQIEVALHLRQVLSPNNKPTAEEDDGPDLELSRGDKMVIELFRQGVRLLLSQLSFVGQKLEIILG